MHKHERYIRLENYLVECLLLICESRQQLVWVRMPQVVIQTSLRMWQVGCGGLLCHLHGFSATVLVPRSQRHGRDSCPCNLLIDISFLFDGEVLVEQLEMHFSLAMPHP